MTAPPTAAPYVTRKLRACDAEIAAAVPRVLASKDDAAIHDLRVAIRRLRTLLKISRKLFGRWHADAVRRAYAEVQRATGELRDEEVLEETLAGVAEHAPGASLGAFLHARKRHEAKLRRAVVARLERGDLDRARLLLKALLVFPIRPKADPELGHFARRTVERARRAVDAKRDARTDDAEALHDLRIAYKELRYAIELLAETLPIDDRAMLEPATIFQKRLGEIHDVDVALAVVTQARRLDEEARAAAVARLSAIREKRIAKYLRELDPLAQSAAHESTSPPSAGPAPPSSQAVEAEPATEDAPTLHDANGARFRAP